MGFSYSNTSAYYERIGDTLTAYDTYTFLVNRLERFPEYKNRDLFLAGERYAGHYATQLAQLILRQNNYSNQITAINLKGIAVRSDLTSLSILVYYNKTRYQSYSFFFSNDNSCFSSEIRTLTMNQVSTDH